MFGVCAENKIKRAGKGLNHLASPASQASHLHFEVLPSPGGSIGRLLFQAKKPRDPLQMELRREWILAAWGHRSMGLRDLLLYFIYL